MADYQLMTASDADQNMAMKTRIVRTQFNPLRRIALFVALGLTCASPVSAGEAVFLDSFASGLNAAAWTVSQSTAGYFAVDASQGDVRLTKGSSHNPGGLQGVFVDLSPVLLGGKISGDFSIQIDFAQALVSGPGLNQVELHAYFESGIFYTVYDNSSGLNAHVWNGGSAVGILPVAGNSGKFRITRVGSNVTGYFNDTPLASENRGSALVGIAFCLQNNMGSDDSIAATFDNFSLTAASTAPVMNIAKTSPGKSLV